MVSVTRRSASVSPGFRSSGTSPSSPPVAMTSTTRWPLADARAIVPPVVIDSSSGCAWKQTRVAIGRSSAPRRSRGASRRRRHSSTASRPAPRPSADRHMTADERARLRCARTVGAGAGCDMPPTSTNVDRATLWGCAAASGDRQNRREAHVRVLHQSRTTRRGSWSGRPRAGAPSARATRCGPSASRSRGRRTRPVMRSSSA